MQITQLEEILAPARRTKCLMCGERQGAYEQRVQSLFPIDPCSREDITPTTCQRLGMVCTERAEDGRPMEFVHRNSGIRVYYIHLERRWVVDGHNCTALEGPLVLLIAAYTWHDPIAAQNGNR